uniref:Uncharacterized protein n=1 Tax=Alexandrium monilatum TaxID=311494 RepID=A0A7S4V5H9_9DINO
MADADVAAVPSAKRAREVVRGSVEVRAATALEVFNVPLFEVPPMLDVRSSAAYAREHVVCAVSTPAEDGLSTECLFQRILDHDDIWGWLLQFPVVVVYDGDSEDRASWLVDTLCGAITDRAAVRGFEGADNTERLLRRLAFQCQQILLLKHKDFSQAFGFACASGCDWTCADFFEQHGPLPRCALLQPRVYLAGRQVRPTAGMLQLLGVSRVAVNADAWDVMDGTSGGGGNELQDRPEDAPGVLYLKCEVADRDDDPDILRVLQGAAQFLAAGAAIGGVGLVRLHGQSRSASVVCALVMLSRGLSVDAAWALFEEAGIRVDTRLVWWDALRRLPTARALEDAPAAAA